MQNSVNNSKPKNKPTKKNTNHEGGNIKGKSSSNKKDNLNNSNNKENIPSNSERKNSKHSNNSNNNNNNNNNNPKSKSNTDDSGNNKNSKQTNNFKGKSNNEENGNRNNKKGNSLSKKKSKQNMGLNKKNSFVNNHKKSNRKNSTNDNIIIKVPQPTEVFDKSIDTICVSKLPSYVNGQMVDNGMDKFITLIKQSLNDLGKVKLIGVEPALALTISIILILEEQKAIRKPIILTKTMEDKNKNLKSGIITELYPNTNKVISKISK